MDRTINRKSIKKQKISVTTITRLELKTCMNTPQRMLICNNSKIQILLKYIKNIVQLDQILGHKTSLFKCKRTEIKQNTLWTSMKLNHVNNRRKLDTFTNMWRLNHAVLNEKWFQKTTKEIGKCFEVKKKYENTAKNIQDKTKTEDNLKL